jgi:hypothetical protein
MTPKQVAQLVIEKRELNERAVKLISFITESETFSSLSPEHRFLLVNQYDAMKLYERTLWRRLVLLGIGDEDGDIEL